MFDDGGVEVLLGAGDGTFSDTVEYPADDGPISVAAGDINGDSHTDLAVANDTSDDASVLLGAGDGTFGSPTNVPTGRSPASVVVAFLNADAHADLAVANSADDDVSILLGKGDGTFTGPTNVQVGDGPASLAAGDFHGDANLDLVVANAGGNSEDASVLLGRGDGSFTGPTTVAVGPNPDSVAVGDFDGDTIADLAFAVQGFFDGRVAVLLGAGDGTFGAPTVLEAGSSATSVAIGDFNTDSVPDVASTDPDAAANSNAGVWVQVGLGDGTFLGANNFQAVGAASVAAGNFNADALPDMATADPRPDKVTALLNITPPASPGPTVSVAAGGSCSPSGRQGTIDLALPDTGEPAEALALSMTSSNPALLPTRNIALGGSDASRTLTVRPVAGRTGSAIVTVTLLAAGRVIGSVPVTVRVAGSGPDRVVGDGGTDILFGQNGPDTLAGLAGNDLLCGGNGPDTLLGGEGDDTLDGGRGKDRLDGGPGANRSTGESGPSAGQEKRNR